MAKAKARKLHEEYVEVIWMKNLANSITKEERTVEDLLVHSRNISWYNVIQLRRLKK